MAQCRIADQPLPDGLGRLLAGKTTCPTCPPLGAAGSAGPDAPSNPPEPDPPVQPGDGRDLPTGDTGLGNPVALHGASIAATQTASGFSPITLNYTVNLKNPPPGFPPFSPNAIVKCATASYAVGSMTGPRPTLFITDPGGHRTNPPEDETIHWDSGGIAFLNGGIGDPAFVVSATVSWTNDPPPQQPSSLSILSFIIEWADPVKD